MSDDVFWGKTADEWLRIEEAAREVDKDWIDRWEGPPSLAVLRVLRAALEEK